MLKLQHLSHLMRRADSLEKTLILGKTEGKRRMGKTELEMVRWYHQFKGQESEQPLGDNKGQGSLACCSPRGRKEPDTTWQMNNNNNLFMLLLIYSYRKWNQKGSHRTMRCAINSAFRFAWVCHQATCWLNWVLGLHLKAGEANRVCPPLAAPPGCLLLALPLSASGPSSAGHPLHLHPLWTTPSPSAKRSKETFSFGRCRAQANFFFFFTLTKRKLA